jgi:hypothetical protein
MRHDDVVGIAAGTLDPKEARRQAELLLAGAADAAVATTDLGIDEIA